MFQPIGDLLVIKREESNNTIKNGSLLFKGAKKSYGEIISMGDGILNLHTGKYDNYGFEVGDNVLFETHRGHSLEVDGEEYLVVGMNTVLAKYNKVDSLSGNSGSTIAVTETS